MRTPAGNRGGALLAAVLVAVLAGGCGLVGGVRRTAPQSTGATGPSGTGGPAQVVEDRRVRVAVPPDSRLHQLEFEDAERGYALFLSTGPDGSPRSDSTAVLFRTADGGRSWQSVRHPRPQGLQQLYAGHGVLALYTEPDQWHISTDAGRTFSRHTSVEAPPDYHRIHGTFQTCCDADERPKVVHWSGAGYPALPVQPPLPELSGVAYAGSELVAAGLRDGRPYVSTSSDAGRTWTPAAAPQADGGLSMVLPMVAPDGDAWLVGHADDRTRFPALWRQVGAGDARRWIPVKPASAPRRFGSAVPLGGGLLAVTGPEGNGLVSPAGYAERGWPVGDNYLRMLGDGTLFAADSTSGRAWLGLGRGADRRWVGLRLDRM